MIDTPSQSLRVLPLGELSRTDFVKFAGAGGDFNPVHHDEAFARDAGFPSVFAMGMLTASLASRLITDWVGIGPVRTLVVRFRAIVWPHEALTARGRISETGSGGHTRLEFEVVNTAIEVKLSGFADIDVRAIDETRRDTWDRPV